MELEKLKEYLNIVLAMEQEIYAQTSTIAELKRECDELGRERYFLPPPEFTQKPPQPPVKDTGKQAAKGIAATAGLTLLFWPAAPVYAAGKIFSQTKKNERLTESYEKELAIYEEDKRCHDEEVAEYERKLADDRARVQTELTRKGIIGKIVEVLEEERVHTRMNLQKIYDEDIVYPKYRKLTMIASIYEYLCAGRCTELPAAYNILEQEMLMNRIIVGIESVVERLDEIKQGQYVLFRAVMDGNQKTEQLLSMTHGLADQMQTQAGLMSSYMGAQADALNDIRKSTQLTAYHAERTADETRYMSRMDYLTGRNDSVMFNLPPD